MATEPASPNSPLAQDPSAHPQPEGPSLCDLVMKGGITSGVIYPKLVAELAAHYTFKNIGGTSAGAIAAGACAAAEYGRSHGRPDAFDELESLPELLGKPTAPSGRSKLFTLFQPDRPAHIRRLLGIGFDRVGRLAHRILQDAELAEKARQFRPRTRGIGLDPGEDVRRRRRIGLHRFDQLGGHCRDIG